jgi:hypothetical protein
MTNVKFHSFVWCLLVAFESFLTQVFKKHFLKMRLFPLFMNIMSKYSPAVVRLLLNSEIHGGSKRFPLLVTIIIVENIRKDLIPKLVFAP